MRLTILASGSSGNALLVEAGGTRVLIDAGLRRRALRTRLSAAGAGPVTAPGDGPAGLDGAFLTHEHSDHVGGAADLLADGVPLYATRGTARSAALGGAAVRPVAAGQELRLGALSLLPVALPHDAAEPVAYVLSDGRVTLGVLTDCGHGAPEVVAAFSACDALVLETNHDRRMLAEGPYPPGLKRRIASADGHLSNDQAAELLGAVLRGGLAPRLVICAHLSRSNNQPVLARAALARVLSRHRGVRTELLIAEQDRPLGALELSPASRLGQQLALPFG